MDINFTDRFKRKFLALEKLKNRIAYCQLRGNTFYSRDNLPSNLTLDGDIFWRNTKMDWQCTTGPALSRMTGILYYSMNNSKMTKLEWLLAIE